MISLSIVNKKGGVGKSTICCSLAQALAIVGHKVLCIDNDNQHNLTTMLGLQPTDKTIRDLLHLQNVVGEELNAAIANCVLESTIPNLHCITSPDALCDDDVSDEKVLANIFKNSFLSSFYDFVLIDNPPGVTKLQRASIYASEYVLVPTELQQLAFNGVAVMMRYLTKAFGLPADHIRIIINKYRPTIRQDAFYAGLAKMFPESITEHAIPVDPTFDEIITENKILFLDRLKSSKAAPIIVGLMSELFPFSEDKLQEDIQEQRNKHLADNARLRVMKTMAKNKEQNK